MRPGTLYIVPTPIGNLKDITLRGLEVLEGVDLVIAEDTRNTKRLLAHYSIPKPLMSYHDHNERTKSDAVIARLRTGETVAIVSDGGMPLISDPGYVLVQKCIAADIPMEVLPGPAALVNALVASGLPVVRFTFEGYPPRTPSKRRKFYRGLREEERTMILYESPHRLIKALRDLRAILGERRCAVIREMTKKFEERFRGTVSEAIDHFEAQGVKGEFVVVLEGGTARS